MLEYYIDYFESQTVSIRRGIQEDMKLLFVIFIIGEVKHHIYDQPRQHVNKQRHYFAHKGPSSQGYGLFVCLFVCF